MKPATISALAFSILISVLNSCHATEPTPLKIGVVSFGTVQWEMAVIQQQGLDRQQNLAIETIQLANPQAGKIGLLAGSIDIGVSDWMWVSQQRYNHQALSFVPYSAAAGALMVPANSKIKTIQDLQQQRLGIAGGALDKNWLLLLALADKNAQLDLNQSVKKTFGAPPILNQQLQQGRVDALLTYWHYAARLEAQGYKRLLDSAAIIQALGIKETIPTLGYVFNEKLGKQHPQTIQSLLKISQQAKDLICESDPVWQSILPLVRAEDSSTQQQLRQRYCAGRVQHWGSAEQQAAAKIYQLVVSHYPASQQQHTQLHPQTFWNHLAP